LEITQIWPYKIRIAVKQPFSIYIWAYSLNQGAWPPEEESHVMPEHSPLFRKTGASGSNNSLGNCGHDWGQGTKNTKTIVVVPLVVGIVVVAGGANKRPGAGCLRAIGGFAHAIMTLPLFSLLLTWLFYPTAK
jgi:hypothetical protein